MKFWALVRSDSARNAELDAGVEFESVTCAADAGHRRPGRRIGDLKVILPPHPGDFVWSWIGDLLVQEGVARALAEKGMTGFSLRPAGSRFKVKAKVPPRVWEVVITGWAGVAPPDSGIHLDAEKSCSTCGYLRYTGLSDPSRLVDEAQWDGSDIFMVWPLPRHPLVSARLANMIRESKFTGVRCVPLSEIDAGASYTPGRLSYWMPKARARELGTALGID